MYSNTPLVSIHKLSKSFKHKTILNDISLNITPGHIVGLIGANGAGKTTLLRHMVGLYLPSRGYCKTLGKPANELEAHELYQLGYLDQKIDLTPWMSVKDHINLLASFYPNWDRDFQRQYIADFEIDLKPRVEHLSSGERQRLAILLVTAYRPNLLILDEPAASLDPLARLKLRDYLLAAVRDNPQCSVILSSHNLAELERIVDQIIILDDGHLILESALDDLQESYSRIAISLPNGNLPDQLSLPGVISYRSQGNNGELTTSWSFEQVSDALNRMFESPKIISLPMSLDELFLLSLQTQYTKVAA